MISHINIKQWLIVISCDKPLSLLFIIYCRVFNACLVQSFLALDACAAFAAVLVASFVARPCFGIVQAQGLATKGNVGLGDIGIWGNDVDVCLCASRHSLAHCLDKLASAVGIDGVVATMIGNHHILQAVALGNAAGD